MFSNTPLITICIPIFNDEKYIGACLDSILKLENLDFEILICDNNSTDSTNSIYSKYEDLRIRVIKNNENIGSLRNFNKCIDNVRGKYFIILPSDDLLVVGGLNKLVNELEKNSKVALAFGVCHNISSNNELLKTPILKIKTGIIDYKNICISIIENFNPLQHPLVRVSALNNKMRFSLHLGTFADIYLWSNLFFAGSSAYFLNEPITCIRRHSGQAQNHYRLITEENTLGLIPHYNYKFSNYSLIKNSHNFLFLIFARLYIKNLSFLSQIELKNIKKLLLIKLIYSILFSIKLCIINKKFKLIIREFIILYKCSKLFGFLNVCIQLFLISINIFKKKLRNI